MMVAVSRAESGAASAIDGHRNDWETWILVPKLRQILTHELGGDPTSWSLPQDLLDDDVVAVFLATGSPCDSHAGAFAAWPGAEPDVTRWFRLAGGPAVGLRSAEGAATGLALHQQESGG